MSYAVDKASTSSDTDPKGQPSTSFALDEKRRAALAEVDNAKFSSVFPLFLFPGFAF